MDRGFALFGAVAFVSGIVILFGIVLFSSLGSSLVAGLAGVPSCNGVAIVGSCNTSTATVSGNGSASSASGWGNSATSTTQVEPLAQKDQGGWLGTAVFAVVVMIGFVLLVGGFVTSTTGGNSYV